MKPILKPISLVGPFRFRFLNHLHSLPDKGGWEEEGLEKLWLYNLHYFDHLNAGSSEERIKCQGDLINRWIAENEPGRGTGWESYPTSLRVVNLIKWALAGNSMESTWLHSLAIQARWLSRRLEWHLMGNHLIANAKALIFAGAFFKGSEADEWLKTGLRILDKEIVEQVLDDGGHFELSPMYHAIVLEDILDLLNVAQTWPEMFQISIVHKWNDTIKKMFTWISGLTHPDGEISFFNDAAFGIASSLASLRSYGTRLNVLSQINNYGSIWNLASSGYIRIARGDAVAILDVAEIGPDYIPGHSHADILSFELSLFCQRLIVNSGTSLYERGSDRLRQRGTGNHNTVQIDGENSSEVWASFRVAKRAHPFDLEVRTTEEFSEVKCSHDGYQRLPGRNTHKRNWRMNNNSLVIMDTIEGRFQSAVARYYLHPEIKVNGDSKLQLPDGKILRYTFEGALSVEKSIWHPEFGKSIDSQCLVLKFVSSEVSIMFSW